LDGGDEQTTATITSMDSSKEQAADQPTTTQTQDKEENTLEQRMQKQQDLADYNALARGFDHFRSGTQLLTQFSEEQDEDKREELLRELDRTKPPNHMKSFQRLHL
jgi:hypothetical protein